MTEICEPNSRTRKRGVEVVVRIRPLDPDSNAAANSISVNSAVVSASGATSSQLTVLDRYSWYGAGEERSFAVDDVMDTNVSNAEVFRRVVEPKLMKITQDRPDTLCFLAYGHTCSGKTHTIAGGERHPRSIKKEKERKGLEFGDIVVNEEKVCTRDVKELKHNKYMSSGAYGHPLLSGEKRSGGEEIKGSAEEPGLLTLCVEGILHREGVVEVAMLEVYMEQIYDLLANGAQRRIRRRRYSATGEYHVMVEGLKTCVITNMQQWNILARFSMNSRRSTATERNSRSSRSHALFTLKSPSVRLCLVDLAGSERQTTFSAKLNRESVSINKSLSRLSTALQALSEQSKGAGVGEDGKRAYVNFRDTTLTVLLQRYLTGSSQTTFLACVHPEERHLQETMSTLRYTERIRRIRTSAYCENGKEEDDHTIMMMALYDEEASDRRLLEELARLRQQVKDQEEARELLAAHQKRIAELEASLLAQQNGFMMRYRSASLSPFLRDSCTPCVNISYGNGVLLNAEEKSVDSQQEGRARITRGGPKDYPINKRLTRWLFLRLLRALPPLHVRFDDYFDAMLPRTVQVVGYVTTMVSLPPKTHLASPVPASPAVLTPFASPKGASMQESLPAKPTSIRRCHLPHHLRRRGLFDEVSSSRSDDDENEENEDRAGKHFWSTSTAQVTTGEWDPALLTNNFQQRNAPSLAFIEVGDFSMGLSMLDAGIPPLVRLHRPLCQSVSVKCSETVSPSDEGILQEGRSMLDRSTASMISTLPSTFWHCDPMMTAESENGSEIPGDYSILAFFQVSPETVKAERDVEGEHRFMMQEKGEGVPSAQCCATVVSTEPLLPTAIVWCVRADAPLRVKEAALQRLALLVRTEERNKHETREGHGEYRFRTQRCHLPFSPARTPAKEGGGDESPKSGISGSVSHGLSSSRSPLEEDPPMPSTAEKKNGERNEEKQRSHHINPPSIASISEWEKGMQKRKEGGDMLSGSTAKPTKVIVEGQQRMNMEKNLSVLLPPSPASSSSLSFSTEMKSRATPCSESKKKSTSPLPIPPPGGTACVLFPDSCSPSRSSPIKQAEEKWIEQTTVSQEEQQNGGYLTDSSLQAPQKNDESCKGGVGLLDMIACHEKMISIPLMNRPGRSSPTSTPKNLKKNINGKENELIESTKNKSNSERDINSDSSCSNRTSSSNRLNADDYVKEGDSETTKTILRKVISHAELQKLHLLDEKDNLFPCTTPSRSNEKEACHPLPSPSSTAERKTSAERFHSPFSIKVPPSPSSFYSSTVLAGEDPSVSSFLPCTAAVQEQLQKKQEHSSNGCVQGTMDESVGRKTRHRHRHRLYEKDAVLSSQTENVRMQKVYPQADWCEDVMRSSYCDRGVERTNAPKERGQDASLHSYTTHKLANDAEEEGIFSDLSPEVRNAFFSPMETSRDPSFHPSPLVTSSLPPRNACTSFGATIVPHSSTETYVRNDTPFIPNGSSSAGIPFTENGQTLTSFSAPRSSTEVERGKDAVDSVKCEGCIVM